MLKRIRSIFLDQEFLRSRIPEKKYLFLAKRILYPSVQADFELQGSHRNASSEFSQSLKAFVSCLVVFVRGSLKIVPGLWARYKLYCQGSAAVLIWLPGRGIRWGLNPACTGAVKNLLSVEVSLAGTFLDPCVSESYSMSVLIGPLLFSTNMNHWYGMPGVWK